MTDRPFKQYDYLDDPAAIYRASFATIRAEAELSKVPADVEKIVVRMIHASGDVGLVPDVEAHPLLVSTARDALNSEGRSSPMRRLDRLGSDSTTIACRQRGALPAARPPSRRAGEEVENDPIRGRGVTVG